MARTRTGRVATNFERGQKTYQHKVEKKAQKKLDVVQEMLKNPDIKRPSQVSKAFRKQWKEATGWKNVKEWVEKHKEAFKELADK